MAASPVQRALLHGAAKPVVWLLALLPVAWLVHGVLTDNLGANPAEALIRSTGDWALRSLCVVLAVTPLRQLTGWHALARFRRLLGLFAFFYAALHVLSYVWLDMGWEFRALVSDIVQRPFILVGALAALVLLLLAATSPMALVRALGGKRWQRLHLGIHLAAWLALLHFFWMRAAKNDLMEVGIYAAIIALLQSWRLVRQLRAHRS